MELRNKKLFIDDYNESKEINRIIYRLVQNDNVVYVSCLSRPDFFDRKILNSNTYLGLHLYLTDFPLHSLRVGKLNILDEFRRQLDRFCDIVGREPDYIDGHRHIQEYFPVSICIKKICNEHDILLRRNFPSKEALRFLAQKGFWRSYFKNVAFNFLINRKRMDQFNAPVASNYCFNEKGAFELLLKRYLENESTESFILHPGPLGWKRHEYKVFCAFTDVKDIKNS